MLNFSLKKRNLFFTILTVFAGIVGVVILFGAHYAKGSALSSTYSYILESAKAQRYSPITGSVTASEIPWIFDGKYIGRGVVLDARNGATEQNLKACEELWLDQSPYGGMCKRIKEVEIVAVRMANMDTKDVVFVPVERIAKLRKGDEVVIQLGEITVQGAVRKLPSLLNVTKWNSSL